MADWTNPDTDGDGLSDGAEVHGPGTDPLNLRVPQGRGFIRIAVRQVNGLS
jgi:hypothetical protein